MGDVSIYNSIRNSKVNTGNVWQYQGMRTFDDSAQVCPARANVSDSGVVGVARDSIQSYAPGCFSALDRMTVESMQRPHYSSYLNASAINDPGVGDDAMSASDYEYAASQPYDTMFGNTITTRPVLPKAQLAPTYRSSDQTAANGAANAQELEANYIRCAVNSVYDQHGCDASATGRGGAMQARQGYSSGGYGGYPASN
ncbi:MAG: hypothetical protein PHG66_04390 [Candidatus Colwellbacteria bacterium]|nr:hypothetical protein [Candidatus Colwellbacteria bacterium]